MWSSVHLCAIALLSVSLVAALPQQEIDAMRAIATSLQADSSWGAPGNPCEWTGVNCTAGQAHIQRIGITSGILPNGTLPAAIANLTDLEELLFRDAPNIRGGLPVEIGSLRKLKLLSVQQMLGWPIAASFPDEIGNCTALETIIVEDTYFGSPLPPSMARLQSLQNLTLIRSSVPGQLPSWLGDLPNLRVIRLEETRMSGTIPSSLGQLRNLTDLIIREPSASTAGPMPPLENCTSLRTLDLYATSCTGPLPRWIFELPNLSFVSLASNKLAGPIPPGVPVSLSLNTLILSNNNLSGSLEPLMRHPNLEVLRVAVNSFSGSLPEGLGAQSRLLRLQVGSNLLTGAIPPALFLAPEIDQIDLGGNNFTGEIPPAWPLSLSKFAAPVNSLRGCLPRNITNLIFCDAMGGNQDLCICAEGESKCNLAPCTCPGARPSGPGWYCRFSTQIWTLPVSLNSSTTITTPVIILGNLTITNPATTITISPNITLGNGTTVTVQGCVTFAGTLQVLLDRNANYAPGTVIGLIGFEGYCGGQPTKFGTETVTAGCRKAQAQLSYDTKSLSLVLQSFDDSGCSAPVANSLNLGAVVGGSVAGGVVLIAAIIIIVLFAVPSCRSRVFPFKEMRGQGAQTDDI